MVAPPGRRSGRKSPQSRKSSHLVSSQLQTFANCGRPNVRKYRDINDSDKYITSYISLKFGSLEKMRITSSDPKDNLGRSGKELIMCEIGVNSPTLQPTSQEWVIKDTFLLLQSIELGAASLNPENSVETM